MGSSPSTLAFPLPKIGHVTSGCSQTREGLLDLDQTTYEATVTAVEKTLVTLNWTLMHETSIKGTFSRQAGTGTIMIDYETKQITAFTSVNAAQPTAAFAPHTVYQAILKIKYDGNAFAHNLKTGEWTLIAPPKVADDAMTKLAALAAEDPILVGEDKAMDALAALAKQAVDDQAAAEDTVKTTDAPTETAATPAPWPGATPAEVLQEIKRRAENGDADAAIALAKLQAIIDEVTPAAGAEVAPETTA